jgi:predicted Co/Zn/Cd cation transporter (cation efflux family)
MISETQQISLERGAAKLSIVSRCVLIAVELFIIYFTSSQAILIDAGFDIAELATVILGFWLVPKWFSSPSEKRPFGLAQGESWLVIVRTLIQIAMSIMFIVMNVLIITSGGNDVKLDEAALLEFGSAVLSVFVLIALKNKNKKLESPSVDADIESWSVDIYTSVGIAVALFLTALLNEETFGWLIPHLDPIIAILFTVITFADPLRKIVKQFKNMTLIEASPETVNKVNEAVASVIEKHKLGTPETYILETGRKTWVSVYIANDTDEISKERYAKAQHEIFDALTEDFIDLFVEVLPEIK